METIHEYKAKLNAKKYGDRTVRAKAGLFSSNSHNYSIEIQLDKYKTEIGFTHQGIHDNTNVIQMEFFLIILSLILKSGL